MPEDKSKRIDARSEVAYKLLGPSEKRRWRNQDKFITCYQETRSKTVSARYAGIKYRAVMRWLKDNIYGFADRLEEADLEFCENLEQLALERVKMQTAQSNPVLMIALLNANLPSKYRPTVVVADETAKDVMRELRTLAKSLPDSKSSKDNVSSDSSDNGSPSNTKSALDQVSEMLSSRQGE